MGTMAAPDAAGHGRTSGGLRHARLHYDRGGCIPVQEGLPAAQAPQPAHSNDLPTPRLRAGRHGVGGGKEEAGVFGEVK